MPNDGFRVAPDGKGYPRLKVCKQESSAFPWKVQKLYGQTPFATKKLLWEGQDYLVACEVAGEHLDGELAMAKKRKATPAPTPAEIHSVVRSSMPKQAREFMGR